MCYTPILGLLVVRRLNMAYYKDFTPCTYFEESRWLCRLMAIGWIERGKPFPKGRTDNAVIERIHMLRDEFRAAFPSIVFRGLHTCSLCAACNAGGATLDQSHINLFIPHCGFLFVAPARIDHYIQAHDYLPPERRLGHPQFLHPLIPSITEDWDTHDFSNLSITKHRRRLDRSIRPTAPSTI